MVKNRLGRSVSKIEIWIYQKELTKEEDGGRQVAEEGVGTKAKARG